LRQQEHQRLEPDHTVFLDLIKGVRVAKPSSLPTSARSIQSSIIEKLECSDRALIAPEVAELLRVTPGTIYRLAKKRAIPSFRVGGSLRFDPRMISRWMGDLVSQHRERVEVERSLNGKAVSR
jgi:excisionase family DNA binding protein